jgi:hypothetical protein
VKIYPYPLLKNILIFILSILISACTPSGTVAVGSEPSIAPTDNPAAVITESATPVINTSISPSNNFQSIRLAWFYKPPETSLTALSADYDLFILTHNDEAARDQLKTLGVNEPFYQYLLMSEIMDPGSCSNRPYNDQVAFHPGDYCWIQNNHPDWFLSGSDGHPLGQGSYSMMDSGNSGWLGFWLERAQFLQENYHWDGIFIDNVEASLSKSSEWGSKPAKYPDDASYQAVIENALKYLYTGYFHPKGKPMYANIIALEDPQVWFRYLQYLDGAMLENFATGWASGTGLSPLEWEQQMQMVSQTQALGKTVILVAQGEQNDLQREDFALASYLLVNDGLAYFRYTNSNHYEEVWTYANYSQDIGTPLGPRYKDAKVWKRDFTKGIVTVDPEAQTATITIR